MMIGPTKSTAVSASNAGDNTLVAGIDGRAIRVLALALVASGDANTVRLESGAGGTALSGQMDLSADGQLVLPFHPAGWFDTAPGAALNLELSDGAAVGGVVVYGEV